MKLWSSLIPDFGTASVEDTLPWVLSGNWGVRAAGFYWTTETGNDIHYAGQSGPSNMIECPG